MHRVADDDPVRAAFRRYHEFPESPLYQVLSATVCTEESLLELARLGRRGQYPTFLFFGAVHQLLLQGVEHPLARYYPSIVGQAALPAAGAGPELVSFCAEHRAELAAVISSRLVQTNVVQRSLGLRLGLSVITHDLPGPVHLIEVGASAGLNLHYDTYGYTVGRQRFGDPESPVQLVADLRGTTLLPDLDVLPPVASRQGIDLDPVDVTDPDARSWLEALVWPENHDQRSTLSAALALAAQDPPQISAGDAIDVLPRLAAELPAGEPRVVFHSATRMHVPQDRLAAFDDAVDSVGDTGPLWRLSIENQTDPDLPGPGLWLRGPDGPGRTVALVSGHLRWIEMLPR